MGRHAHKGMVILLAPAPHPHGSRWRRARLRAARLGTSPRSRPLIGALAVGALVVAIAALYALGGSRPAPAPGVQLAGEDSMGSRSGAVSSTAAIPTSSVASAAAATPMSAIATASASGAPLAISALAAGGIPVVALQAYQNAAALVDAANPSCAITWTLLAAIGRVESNHGRSSGNLLVDGTSQPPVMGLLLDGANGFATIRDTDGGVLDGSATFDRAIGPMQFIPSTWKMYASDGNGDGKTDPFNIYDASLGAAKYLCKAGGALGTADGLQRAVYSYNHDASYVSKVLALANEYAVQFNQNLLPITAVTDEPSLDPGALPPASIGGGAPGAAATPSPTDTTPTSDTVSGTISDSPPPSVSSGQASGGSTQPSESTPPATGSPAGPSGGPSNGASPPGSGSSSASGAPSGSGSVTPSPGSPGSGSPAGGTTADSSAASAADADAGSDAAQPTS